MVARYRRAAWAESANSCELSSGAVAVAVFAEVSRVCSALTATGGGDRPGLNRRRRTAMIAPNP
jgi:DNA-binding IclR family transcriptional regulator